MGCLNALYKSIWEKENSRKNREKEYFFLMKKGLKESLNDIHDVFRPINDWEELMELNPDDELEEDNAQSKILKKSKTNFRTEISCCSRICKTLNRSICCLILFFICGWIFCLMQLIGIQAGIIILNALFGEIVDEFKFLGKDFQKDYNIYERIEIATYKSIPEIDVWMF